MSKANDHCRNIIIRQVYCLKIFLAFLLCGYIYSCKRGIKSEVNVTDSVHTNNIIQTIKERSKENILVCAHRGFHNYAPENSIEAIKEAIANNIDIAEIDLRTTKDSIIVLMHDDKIDRTTTGSGFVSNYTYEELMRLNLKIGDSITTHKVPTLEQVLLLSKDKIILNLDIKNVNPSQFYKILKKYQMEHQVFSFIWDKELINQMVKIDSLYAVLPLSETFEEMQYNLERYYSSLQHLTEKSYNEINMEWARKNGVEVFVNSLWGIDESFINGNTLSIDSLIALKPDIIQTDYPKKLVEYLKTKNN